MRYDPNQTRHLTEAEGRKSALKNLQHKHVIVISNDDDYQMHFAVINLTHDDAKKLLQEALNNITMQMNLISAESPTTSIN